MAEAREREHIATTCMLRKYIHAPAVAIAVLVESEQIAVLAESETDTLVHIRAPCECSLL